MGVRVKRRAHALGTRQGDEEGAAREPCRRCTAGAAIVRRATLATRVSIAARVSVRQRARSETATRSSPAVADHESRLTQEVVRSWS
jgi:hypothetical protein